MPVVNFFLKEPKSKGETLVYLFFSFHNQRLKYSTAEKIDPEFWNKENQRARETKKFPEYPEFNANLSRIEATVKTIYRTLLNDGKDITPTMIKEELDIQLKRTARKERVTFFAFIESYLEEQKNIKGNATIKSHKVAFRVLKNYCKDKKCTLDFEDINIDFYNSFIDYMMTTCKFAQNTIADKIKHLKVFMNEATERGINTNLEFRSKKFKKVSEDTDKIYLTTEELKRIYELDLSQDKHYDKVRDLFIVGCYTGLRFSDFTQIRKENLIEGNKLKIRTEKTGETVVIPVHPYVKAILEKYNGSIEEPPTNQALNEVLKAIGRLAKIKEMISTTITRGGKLEKSIIEKHKLICSHTARRSFATNLYLADVPSITIMKITGHKTEKNFLRYIRISQEENANKLLSHPFFK